MVGLKKLFYGAVKGTRLQVSKLYKRVVSIGFIVFLIPLNSLLSAQVFLWLTGRMDNFSFDGGAISTIAYIAAGLPGLILGAIKAVKKIKAVEAKRATA